MEPIDLARTIVDALEDKKGEDILLLDLQDLPPLTDFFIICSGNSERTVGALMDAAIDGAREVRAQKPRLEGNGREGWVLADFGSVVVHVFSTSQRDYYRLEELWEEAKVLLHLQ